MVHAVQGDVMSGSIATFLGWAHGYLEATGKTPGDIPPAVLAAYGGCSVARQGLQEMFCHKKEVHDCCGPDRAPGAQRG